jgi:hypothetical protein
MAGFYGSACRFASTAGRYACGHLNSTRPAMPHTLIDYYKALEDGSRQMLEAARADDWGQVADVKRVARHW